MLALANTVENYLSRKKLGEKVISLATLFGYEAMRSKLPPSDNFVVLEMGKSYFSFYRYKVSNGKFRVLEYKENIDHQISNFLTPEVLGNDAVIRWWNCVFYERDGICTYDNYYNGLAISDNSDITFEKLIDDVANCVSSLPSMESTKQLFLTGDLMKNPVLRYVIQQQLKQGEVHLLQEVSLSEDSDENEMVILPTDRLEQLALNTNETLKLKEITSASISITLPIDSMNYTVTSDVKWGDLIDDGQKEQKDYSVGNLDFKNISLRVECDAFQNIFLACQDSRGNRKAVKIN